MRNRKLIAGNWKLHKTVAEAQNLVSEVRELLNGHDACDVVIAPTYLAMWAVAQSVRGSNIELAAQDVFFEDEGAYTGAISAPLLRDVGCTYALVGHSERRIFFGETLASTAKRLRAALRAGLTPILCIGETLHERREQQTATVVSGQLEAAIHDLDTESLRRLVIAYEPVWAIGTGKVATPAQAQEVHAMIRAHLRAHDAAAADLRILYGGSVKPENARVLLQQPDIDGALIGGASLDAPSFCAIARATAEAS